MAPRRLVCRVSLLLLLIPASAAAAVTAWTDVTVRLYDGAALRPDERTAALAAASIALSAASIDVHWRSCEAQPRACDAVLAPRELAVRIVRSPVPPGYRGTLPLGDALIDTRSGTGVLATIYYDRVVWLAREAGVATGPLLGRAIAHELGHLLMATRAHGRYGLMRAIWSRDEVRRGKRGDWIFAEGEVAALAGVPRAR
jgi:hypothetical protein